MDFFANNQTRPVRLSEETRAFAYESLHHKYGKDTKKTPAVSLDDIEGFEKLSKIRKYDLAIEHIARYAPIRICKNEKISGAATLANAIAHNVPATYQGKNVFSSVSHLTIDFETVLKKGLRYIKEQAEKAYLCHKDTPREPFAQSCLSCLQAFEIWHKRYLDALKDKKEYQSNYRALCHVPFEPPRSFHEAVQSLWIVFSFVRLCGNWPGIGRLDELLGEYLERDLKDGKLTISQAREILAHFFIKGCEWICGGDYTSGDAQHYQNIVLAGVNKEGKEVTNAVTYLTLDILEELGISDFPTTVRINKNTDPLLLRRISQVIRLGGGVIAIYNEDLILKSLTDYGYPEEEARCFANDGCWEVQIPGKTYFIYTPIDALQILQKNTLDGYSEAVDFPDFNALLQCYCKDLKDKVRRRLEDKFTSTFCLSEQSETKWEWKKTTPCTVVSLFEQGCIEKGLSYLEGGPVYNVYSPHIGGLPDVVNSLYAIKKLVYEERRLRLPQLLAILKNNWENEEALRRYVSQKYAYFGNDNDEADWIAKEILSHFADACDDASKLTPFQTPAGVSTFGRQLEWAPSREATPFGKKAHEVLAGNLSPTPGTDKEGATAIIRSYCKADLKRTVSGAALDLKLLPSSVKGEEGLKTIETLIRGFVSLGGFFFQPDVADAELLKQAREHPEDYPTLSVRVSGWNARFVTLSKQWQDMIIAQTEKEQQ